MKKLLLVIMFLIPCSICSFLFKRKATFFIDENTSENTKIVYLQNRNLYLDVNDYVFGVVAAEMPALFNDEALKAQAVAARSYLLSSKDSDNLYSTNLSAQAYLDIYELKKRWGSDFNKYYEKVINAIKALKDVNTVIVGGKDRGVELNELCEFTWTGLDFALIASNEKAFNTLAERCEKKCNEEV